MELKNMSCPSCGANLKFNNKSHNYECEYCGSTYKDTKANAAGDPRVELNPEDLEMLQPQAKGLLNKNDSHAAIAVFVVIGIIVVTTVLGFVLIAKSMFDMVDNTIDGFGEMDDDFDFDHDFDHDFDW